MNAFKKILKGKGLNVKDHVLLSYVKFSKWPSRNVPKAGADAESFNCIHFYQKQTRAILNFIKVISSFYKSGVCEI